MTAKLHKIEYNENDLPAKLEVWKMLDEFIDFMPETYLDAEKDLR